MPDGSATTHLFHPKLLTTIGQGYGLADPQRDAIAGMTVAVVALPLSMAIAVASSVTPERGLFTAIVGDFLVSALGGSRHQVGGARRRLHRADGRDRSSIRFERTAAGRRHLRSGVPDRCIRPRITDSLRRAGRQISGVKCRRFRRAFSPTRSTGKRLCATASLGIVTSHPDIAGFRRDFALQQR